MKLKSMAAKNKLHHHQYSAKKVETLEGYPEIKGIDFEKKQDLKNLLDSFLLTGFQATNLGKAIDTVKQMRKYKATIFLGFSSNLISSGIRDIITFLVKHKFVDVVVTSAGGIEEDVIKSLKPFVIGDFNVPGKLLFEKGINRIGNIFVPNDRYLYFEKFITPFLDKIYNLQKKQNKAVNVTEMLRLLGDEINKEDSYLYHAAKNNIPVFCPGITDGSFGDMIFFQKQRTPDFQLDITKDMADIVKIALNAEKTGAIILGGGIAKHFILNANIFREGLEYAVYISTAQEYDGSDSGAKPDEAITWGKIKPDANAVKVHGDATIIFPLVVAATFAEEFHKKQKT